MAITLDEPTLFDNVLYYGLFLGAIFQLACIAAVIFIPQSEKEEELPDDSVADSKSYNTAGQSFGSAKKVKKEKKKHR